MKRLLSIATLYPNPYQPRFGTFVARQMEALAARGDWDVTVINPIGIPPVPLGRYKPLNEAVVSAVEHDVAVHRMRFPLLPAVGGPFNPAMIARAVLPRARLLHREAPFAMVDAQFFYPDGPAAARVAADLGLPLSIKARGADISFWARKPYALKRMLRAASRADLLLAVSEALADDMKSLGFPAEKMAVHYTGLDRERFRPLPKEECRARLQRELGVGLEPDQTLLATIGALIPRKGQGLVLGALNQIADAKLILVGTGPDRLALEEQAFNSGLRDRVYFAGSIDHEMLPVVLSAADAMVLPSASEGLANAWVEALACGTPLVITGAGGALEVVTSPVAGRIVAREASAIAEGVRQVLAAGADPEQVARFAARFSWQSNAAELARLYNRITGG